VDPRERFEVRVGKINSAFSPLDPEDKDRKARRRIVPKAQSDGMSPSLHSHHFPVVVSPAQLIIA
jgi:hypothetical protein